MDTITYSTARARKALKETFYLLRSRRNAQRLLESIAALESGKGKVRNLAK